VRAAGVLAGDQPTAHGQVVLRFAQAAGGRTWLARQRAAYPFHVGRCLSICGDPTGMASVYLQCCSGGLFENDDVRLDIETGAGALAHVRTSAATIVHSMRDTEALQAVHLAARSGSHLEYLPDSLILFPGARLMSSVYVRLHERASVLAGEIVLAHDPQAQGRCFDRLQSVLVVSADDGALLLRDRWTMRGDLLTQRQPGITGPHPAQGTLFALSRTRDVQMLLDRVRAVLPASADLYVGASRLPSDCGVVVRALSSDEPLLRATLHAVRDVARTFLLETGTVTNELVQPAG
jgi:urease accessory protein